MLFGGNLVAELLFALALGVFVQAFGYSLELHELLFIDMAVRCWPVEFEAVWLDHVRPT